MISIYYFNKCKLIYKYDIHVWFKLKYMFKKTRENIFSKTFTFFYYELKRAIFYKKEYNVVNNIPFHEALWLRFLAHTLI